MKEKSIIQQNLKKIIGVIVVSVFAIITIYTVFRGSGISLNELTASLKEASWEGILLASVSMLGFIYFEGEALRVLVRHMGYPAKRSHGFVYSAASTKISPAASPTACVRRSTNPLSARRRSSQCSSAWAASPSTTCSTPTTWASA